MKCFGTTVLSLLCEVFSREYYRSRGGVPDLVLWDPLKKTCKVSIGEGGREGGRRGREGEEGGKGTRNYTLLLVAPKCK